MTETAGFECFATEQSTALGRLALRLTGERESARDLVQDVLVEVFRQWPRVQGATEPRAYVRRMLVNRYLNTRRRRVAEVFGVDVTDRQDPAHTPALGELMGDRDALWRALAALPSKQRTVLVLRHYEGLDDPMIAGIVGCRRATVRSLAARGLAALRASPHLSADGSVSAGHETGERRRR